MVENVANTTVKTPRSVIDIPVVARTTKDKGDSDAPGLDTDTSIAGAMRRERIKGQGRKSGTDLPTWALITGGKGALSSLSDLALDDATSEQASKLTNAVKMVGGALGTGLALFSIQATLVGGEAALDTRRALKNRTAAKVAAEETSEKVAKVGTEAATDKFAKVVAEEGAEKILKGGTKAAFETAAKSAVKLGSKHVPFAGAFVTAAFAANEVSGFWSSGEKGKAIAAGFVGAAETVGNFFTLGFFGDAFREVARQGAILVGGDEYADIGVSDVRALYQAGVEVKEQFTQAAAMPTVQTYAPRPSGLVLAHG